MLYFLAGVISYFVVSFSVGYFIIKKNKNKNQDSFINNSYDSKLPMQIFSNILLFSALFLVSSVLLFYLFTTTLMHLNLL
tara:strand:- start:3530 stop:3769 length:240 start_codon:yes stop_codon:yes gene_type:complete